MTDRFRLLELAQEAGGDTWDHYTPGIGRDGGLMVCRTEHYSHDRDEWRVVCTAQRGGEKFAAFIAAADPKTVIALIQENIQLERLRAEHNAALARMERCESVALENARRWSEVEEERDAALARAERAAAEVERWRTIHERNRGLVAERDTALAQLAAVVAEVRAEAQKMDEVANQVADRLFAIADRASASGKATP